MPFNRQRTGTHLPWVLSLLACTSTSLQAQNANSSPQGEQKVQPAQPAQPSASGTGPNPPQAAAPLQVLPVVRVQASAELPGVKYFDTDQVRKLPILGNDITSVLRLSPRVQVSNTRDSALTQGEIAPAEISINGAKPYQNLFLLDGLALNNDLDPAVKDASHYADIPGATLGMPIDKELICSLELLDSNISAEHGRFEGGVVKAELCDARRAFGGRVTFKMARSAWTNIFVDPARASALELSSSEDLQPRWDKQFWTVSAEARPDDKLGVVMQASYARSEIPLRGFVSTQTPGDASLAQKTQLREQKDAMAKFTWRASERMQAWLTLRRQPLDDSYFNINGRDTEFTIQGGGTLVAGGAVTNLGAWTLRQELSLSDMENSRRGVVPYMRVWSWSATDKNWGDGSRGTSSISTEGAWGNVDSSQKTHTYTLRATANAPRPAWGWNHQLRGGLELTRRDAQYSRPNDHLVYLGTTAYRVATTTCTSPTGVVDTESCSLARSLRFPNSGQFWRYRDNYQAGAFQVQAAQYALWLENRATRGDLSLTLGLRGDRDELAGQATLAPRLSGQWVLDGERRSTLEFGLNRYYGRSFFNAALREKRETLKVTQTRRASDWAWVDGERALPMNSLADLNVPYDDEAVLGLRRHLGVDTVATIKWVHRESRDQVVRARVRDTSGAYANNQFYRYENSGRGSADVVSLEFAGQLARNWLAGGRHHWELGTGWTRARTNHVDYETTLAETDSDRDILYQGQVIRYSDLPADNYNRPWSARLTLSSEWEQLSLSQMLRWTGGYRRVANTGKTEVRGTQELDVFSETAFPSTFSWDISLRWQARWGTHRPFAQLTVGNLTNKRNIIMVSSAGVVTYETGRSAAVQVGYEF